MAAGNGQAGDLTTLSSEARPPRPGPLARIAAIQANFNQQLTTGLKELSGGGPFWWLAIISFFYGVAHAAGPGHGKIVISSYLVANEARVPRGVLIAFLAALVQALVAIGLVGVMAVILNMTSMAITGTAKAFEVGSFALVAALGAYLLARKGREAWVALKRTSRPIPRNRASATERHRSRDAHAHGLTACCHDHAAPLARVQPGMSGMVAAVLSVGVRPCTGALVVLVFALAQGIFWAGVASTFLMALGTAITVAFLAALAVGAKDIARRLARSDGGYSGQIMLGLEFVAALLLTAMGAGLLFSALYA
jgi:ABC-type nickel/cobalt efflux system permease component RcnA